MVLWFSALPSQPQPESPALLRCSRSRPGWRCRPAPPRRWAARWPWRCPRTPWSGWWRPFWPVDFFRLQRQWIGWWRVLVEQMELLVEKNWKVHQVLDSFATHGSFADFYGWRQTLWLEKITWGRLWKAGHKKPFSQLCWWLLWPRHWTIICGQNVDLKMAHVFF